MTRVYNADIIIARTVVPSAPQNEELYCTVRERELVFFILLFKAATVVGFERSNVVVHESNRTVEVCAVVYEPFLEGLPEIFNVSIFTENGRASEL